MIHSTAVIDPGAQLGANVSVGPFAIIEAGAQIGDNCTIQGHAVIGGHVKMGPNNLVGYGAIVGGDPQDHAFAPTVQSEVIIGTNNHIREYCTIHRGSREGGITSVGDSCFLMGGVHLAHDVRVGNRVVIANNSLLAGHVQIADGVFIGGGCVFHQFVRVGPLAICRGISGYGKDVPPYATGAGINGVAGLNVIGLRRAGFSSTERAEIKSAFSLLYRSGLNVTQALEQSKSQEWSEKARVFWDFVAAAKKRGICDLLRNRDAGEDHHD